MKEGLTEETRVHYRPIMAGEPGDELEQKGLGVWLMTGARLGRQTVDEDEAALLERKTR